MPRVEIKTVATNVPEVALVMTEVHDPDGPYSGEAQGSVLLTISIPFQTIAGGYGGYYNRYTGL